MAPRYQVFVSSTYKDLRKEREQVTEGLLLMKCLVAGMELFPASNENAWESIKKIIDQCDYYIVLTAGKYGDIDPKAGKSFTEREYDHARSQGIPILAFLHDNLGSLSADNSESTDDGKERLKKFHERLKKNHYVRRWNATSDLKAYVIADMYQVIEEHPRPGWVRASDASVTAEAEAEISSLRGQVIDLQAQLDDAKATSDPTKGLAQGEDPIDLLFTYTERDPATRKAASVTVPVAMTWNEILGVLGPLLYPEESEVKLRARLVTEARARGVSGAGAVRPMALHRDSWNTVKVQLVALGLMEPSERRHSVADAEKYWSLTEAGRTALQSVAAVRRPDWDVMGS